MHDFRDILNALYTQKLTPEQAQEKLKNWPYQSLEGVHLDTHRSLRRGFPEVIFGQGKSLTQLQDIVQAHLDGQKPLFMTRISPAVFETLQADFSTLIYYSEAQIVCSQPAPEPLFPGKILVVTGGSTDIPVAMEAVITARYLQNTVETLFDVGVAGLHRLLSHLDKLQSANVIIVAAGMEGALPSVVSGLVSKPVIGLPTSVGYGTALNGFTPLLAMLTSCAEGIGVVNIDNGFGAGYLAGSMNRLNITLP